MMKTRSSGVQRSGRPSLRPAGVGGRCSGIGSLEARSLGGCGIPYEVKQGTRPRIRQRRARCDGGVHPRQGGRRSLWARRPSGRREEARPGPYGVTGSSRRPGGCRGITGRPEFGHGGDHHDEKPRRELPWPPQMIAETSALRLRTRRPRSFRAVPWSSARGRSSDDAPVRTPRTPGIIAEPSTSGSRAPGPARSAHRRSSSSPDPSGRRGEAGGRVWGRA